jgi:sugar lactone lactonase YvrE
MPSPPSPHRNRSQRPRSAARGVASVVLSLGTLMCQPSAPGAGAVAPPGANGVPSAAASLVPPGSARASGVVRVLSADANTLLRPTTAAFRGSTPWVAIGQLSALFEPGVQPRLPFAAVSLELESGAFGAESITLPGDYYPEGITAAADGTLYIGSIMQGVIMKVAPDSNVPAPFLTRGVARRGVLGLTVDAGRKLLWFCDSNPKLDVSKKAGDLVGVQLADAREVVRHSLPTLDGGAPPFCNDVIVGTDGSVWLTETAGGRIFRIPADAALRSNSAEAWLVGGEIAPPPSGGSGPNGLEWVGRYLVVANSGRGTLVALDPESPNPDRGARTLSLSDAQTQAPVSLCSPDGLERVPGSADTLVVIENGGCSSKTPRISRVTLSL